MEAVASAIDQYIGSMQVAAKSHAEGGAEFALTPDVLRGSPDQVRGSISDLVARIQQHCKNTGETVQEAMDVFTADIIEMLQTGPESLEPLRRAYDTVYATKTQNEMLDRHLVVSTLPGTSPQENLARTAISIITLDPHANTYLQIATGQPVRVDVLKDRLEKMVAISGVSDPAIWAGASTAVLGQLQRSDVNYLTQRERIAALSEEVSTPLDAVIVSRVLEIASRKLMGGDEVRDIMRRVVSSCVSEEMAGALAPVVQAEKEQIDQQISGIARRTLLSAWSIAGNIDYTYPGYNQRAYMDSMANAGLMQRQMAPGPQQLYVVGRVGTGNTISVIIPGAVDSVEIPEYAEFIKSNVGPIVRIGGISEDILITDEELYVSLYSGRIHVAGGGVRRPGHLPPLSIVRRYSLIGKRLEGIAERLTRN